MSYNKYYSEWSESPLSFWDKKAKDISWKELYKKTLHKTENYYEWFHQGKLNTCFNCIDKHVENGKSEKVAIIYDSPITNTKKKNYLQPAPQKSIFLSCFVRQCRSKKGR